MLAFFSVEIFMACCKIHAQFNFLEKNCLENCIFSPMFLRVSKLLVFFLMNILLFSYLVPFNLGCVSFTMAINEQEET